MELIFSRLREAAHAQIERNCALIKVAVRYVQQTIYNDIVYQFSEIEAPSTGILAVFSDADF